MRLSGIGLTGFVLAFAMFPICARAAQLSGEWVGQLTAQNESPTSAHYDHVTLKADHAVLSGRWGPYVLAGSVAGKKIEITLTESDDKPAGTLQGSAEGDGFAGTGSVVLAGRPGNGGGNGNSAVTWNLTRAAVPPATPKSREYEPVKYYGIYSAEEPPVLHIFPGDTVTTRTVDAARDAKIPRHGSGGDVNTGPFYIEGALPGDTLVVKIIRLRTNKPTARQGSRFNQYAVTQAYQLAAKYDPSFNGEWELDQAHNLATLAPSTGLPHLTVPMKTMLGCISVAPPGDERYRGTDLGPFGGNLDYNDNVEGTTLYFPVFHPGALLGMGDVHAAMGDGEVTGTGLETSADVTFTVDVIRGYSTPQVRAETKDYLISFGVSGSVQDSIQLSTSQLAEWVKHDYRLNDSEVAILFAATLKYDIAELVDPHFDVVAKIPKSILAGMK